ncbi:hypothetical protein ACOME3_003111 [Neoechinorhynchus agilis]
MDDEDQVVNYGTCREMLDSISDKVEECLKSGANGKTLLDCIEKLKELSRHSIELAPKCAVVSAFCYHHLNGALELELGDLNHAVAKWMDLDREILKLGHDVHFTGRCIRMALQRAVQSIDKAKAGQSLGVYYLLWLASVSPKKEAPDCARKAVERIDPDREPNAWVSAQRSLVTYLCRTMAKDENLKMIDNCVDEEWAKITEILLSLILEVEPSVTIDYVKIKNKESPEMDIRKIRNLFDDCQDRLAMKIIRRKKENLIDPLLVGYSMK